VKYNTVSEVSLRKDGTVVVRLEYKQQNNPHLKPEESCFGVAKIVISPGSESGKARWDDDAGKEDSGSFKWQRVQGALTATRKREKASRIQRKQQKFRAALIMIDEQCVLSGERTKETLEAAHIIPAEFGGVEVVENGLLLRADLRRIFDANLISIDSEGEVSASESLSDAYRQLLKGKRLGESALGRVKRALEHPKGKRQLV
jgi:hypothetical protein